MGDTKLDWYGAEAGQGTYQGQQAEGTPLAWTTDEPGDDGYQPENRWVVKTVVFMYLKQHF